MPHLSVKHKASGTSVSNTLSARGLNTEPTSQGTNPISQSSQVRGSTQQEAHLLSFPSPDASATRFQPTCCLWTLQSGPHLADQPLITGISVNEIQAQTIKPVKFIMNYTKKLLHQRWRTVILKLHIYIRVSRELPFSLSKFKHAVEGFGGGPAYER